MSKKILVWFRNDLRLHDNEMLVEAIAKADAILPVYFFDPRHFESTRYQSLKTGALRSRFLIESVAALRQSFQKLGGDILIIKGRPEDELPQLVQQFDIAEVYHHREVASEETAVSAAVEDLLWKHRVNLKHFIGHTLYNKEDLPFPIKDIPDVFTQFKKKTERDAAVKPCFLTPTSINFLSLDDWGNLPTLVDLGFEQTEVDLLHASAVAGGEEEGFRHLHDFLHAGEGMALANASLKKNEIVSRLSPWLAVGCLSPRAVYWKMKEAEASYGLKPYFNQIIVGLLWRDYYRFMFKKYGNAFFRWEGFTKKTDRLAIGGKEALNTWKAGETPNHLVNSMMHTLNTTGYINHAARQLVATYLVYEMKVDWTLGAAYFEEKLLDYNPASNWGNWANLAGVGNDHRLTTSFDFEKQLKIIDPKGTYSQVAGV